MSPARRSDVSLAYATHPEESFRVACYEWGDPASANVAFCVHGLTRNARDFDFLAGALAADGWRVIAVDMPGRGESEWLKYKEEYNNVSYMTHIYSLFAKLALPPVHWIGTSMGGIIGMMVAAQSPERIKKLVLNDVGAFISGDALKRLGNYVGKKMRFATRVEAQGALREIYAPFGIKDERHWQHFFEHDLKDQPDGSVARNYDPAVAGVFANPEAITDADLTPFWQAITCPVMVVRGAESDILTETTLEAMQVAKPGTHTLTVAGAGHAPPLMTADQIEPIISWLKKQSPSPAA